MYEEKRYSKRHSYLTHYIFIKFRNQSHEKLKYELYYNYLSTNYDVFN